ncbi:hypothetical protein INR49_030011 [Caranx melampygus]|nr:hypothetical protein INR49_030011 [Caranx melampygus]
MEALGASCSSCRVLSMSSSVNSRRGNMVAREKFPYRLPPGLLLCLSGLQQGLPGSFLFLLGFGVADCSVGSVLQDRGNKSFSSADTLPAMTSRGIPFSPMKKLEEEYSGQKQNR